MDLRQIGWDGMIWIALIWLRIGTSGRLLWTFGFHIMLGSSWVGAQLAASQEGLSSMNENERNWMTVISSIATHTRCIKKLFFHLSELTILHSYTLLSSCSGPETTHTELWLCLLRYMRANTVKQPPPSDHYMWEWI
jgi:hypothetical protein